MHVQVTDRSPEGRAALGKVPASAHEMPVGQPDGRRTYDVDAVIRELAWQQARREEALAVVLELTARYGETSEWDARTWDEYEHLVDARAWERVRSLMGGAA